MYHCPDRFTRRFSWDRLRPLERLKPVCIQRSDETFLVCIRLSRWLGEDRGGRHNKRTNGELTVQASAALINK